MRPPTRFCASKTTGSWPIRSSSYAATSPAIPAPTTTTFFGSEGIEPSISSRNSGRGRPPEPLRSARRCSGRFLLAAPRRRGGHELGEQAAGCGGDSVDCILERLFVALRRLREAADLADVLQ